MFLGILVGMFIFGIITIQSNYDDPNFNQQIRIIRTFVRVIVFLFAVIGFCGSIGWIIEVIHG